MRRRAFLGVAALFPSCSASDFLSDKQVLSFPSDTSSPRSDRRLADMLGVNVHLVDPDPGQFDAMQQAGFRWVRCDLDWATVEREYGVYDFSRYDNYHQSIIKAGFSPYAILDYGNPLYNGGLAPVPGSATYAAFVRFTRAAAERFAGAVRVWEIWNEPNGRFWKPRPDPKSYAALCRELAQVIRQADPSARIAAGGTGGIDTSFLEVCAKLGAFEHVDFVSVHPYRRTSPEGAIAEMDRIQTSLRNWTGNAALEVIAGEWGYSTTWTGISAEIQAAYYTRMMLSNFAAGKSIVIWYDLMRDGTDATNEEHNFGLIDYKTLTRLVAYRAASVLTQMLGHGTFVEGGEYPDGSRVIHADRRGVPISVFWATSRATTKVIRTTTPATAVDMMGNTLWTLTSPGSQTLQLDPQAGPVYLVGRDVNGA